MPVHPLAAIMIGAAKPKKSPEPEKDNGLETIMKEFVSAVAAEDSKGAAEAFQAAFDFCESQPHEEAGE